VRRIGTSASIPIAVRVVAATNSLPASAVKEGKLKQDLFYRLKSFHLALPPLRERGDDIPLLARYYLESFGEKYQRPTMRGLLTLWRRCSSTRGPAMCVSYATQWNGWRCGLPAQI
jgi:transcriptional regulator with PAS, ATPase and Fis domain